MFAYVHLCSLNRHKYSLSIRPMGPSRPFCWTLDFGLWTVDQPMTVLEGIQKSAEFLAKRGVDSPRLQAELLLAHVLKLPRMKLYLNFERALAESETDA